MKRFTVRMLLAILIAAGGFPLASIAEAFHHPGIRHFPASRHDLARRPHLRYQKRGYSPRLFAYRWPWTYRRYRDFQRFGHRRRYRALRRNFWYGHRPFARRGW